MLWIKLAPFKTRTIVADSSDVHVSKLIYLIQLWGDCPNYLLNLVQILQNRAASIYYTQCNSVHYHSLLLVHKVKLYAKSEYLLRAWVSEETINLSIASQN